MNLLPGAVMLAAIGWGLKREPARLERLRHGDWAGVLTVATGLGCLITLLEEGNRNDWFHSPEMRVLGAVVMLTLGTVIELRVAEPFINLGLLEKPAFGAACLVGTVFGMGMYGVMYVLLVYLARLQGYNAGQIGHTIMWSGVPQLLMMPVAAGLAKRHAGRVLVAWGLALFALSCLINGRLTHLTAHDQLRLTQLIRAVGMPLVIVPLTTLATRGPAASETGSASALFNMLRNLGGSIGIALLATRVDVGEATHRARLAGSISLYQNATLERLELLHGYLTVRGADAHTATARALRVLDHTLNREALVAAYGDAFTLLGVVLLGATPLVWFIGGRRGNSVVLPP